MGIPAFLAIEALTGCSDYGMVADPDESHVVMDPIRQPEEISELDVFVLVDQSGSMSDNFDEVGNGMIQLREDIDGLVTDSRFAFATTDPNYPGFIGPYDSSQTLDIIMGANNLAPYGGEAGFAASYTAYNAYTDRSEFFRAGAAWLFFYVSDEEEQSGIAPDIWQDEFLSQLKVDTDGNPTDEFDVVAITSLPPDPNRSCLEQLEEAYGDEYGCGYINLVENYYGKDAIDITSPDWDEWLSSASYLTNKVREIPLSEVPMLESLRVWRFDGEEKDELVYDDEWTYEEPPVNTVFLDPEYDLGWEDDIIATYKVDDGDD